MITAQIFRRAIDTLARRGLSQPDIDWAENLKEPSSATDFARETIYVICNSGMRFTVARQIYERVMKSLVSGASASVAFNHAGKVKAIDHIWNSRETLFREYGEAADKLAVCEALPWIGAITKYHLAKNFGLDIAKPDIHLQRLADLEGTSPQLLCERLARATGYRVATVDTLLWRACATGVLNSRTGKLA